MKFFWFTSSAVIAVAILSGVFAAQTPRYETFAGYSYDRHGNTNLNGWNVAVTRNLNHWVGLTGDVNGHYMSGEFDIAEDHQIGRAHIHSFRAGPQFSRRPTGSRAAVFANVLVGATHFYLSGRPPGSRGAPGYLSETGLAVAAGGGVEVLVSPKLSIRIIQAHFDSFRRPHHDFDEGLRLSFGVVLRSR